MYKLYILLLELMNMKNKSFINLNEPSYYILLALSKEPMSGYELTRNILNITKGRLEVRTGTMYPTLKKLVDHKLIELVEESSQERNKKTYHLTEEGEKILQHEVDMLKEKLEEVKLIMNETEGGHGI
jgi:DNA-binding PadR family transcriptional regulator